MAGQAIITIENKEWLMDVAVQPWELTQGLGGLPEIPAGTGMLFDLGYEQAIEVTTVPMCFPLDIAFLSDDLVITEIYRNIEPGYTVTSQAPAKYFLEVNSGEFQDLTPGSQVAVELLSMQETTVVSDPVALMFGLAGFLLLGTLVVNIVSEKDEQPEKNPELLPQVSKPSGNNYVLQSDRMGNIIITKTDEPGKDVFLQFESDKELIYDLLKDDEKEDIDGGWEVRIRRNEPRASILDAIWTTSASAQPLPATSKKPTRDEVTVETWQERDRLGIWITDKRTNRVIAQWWDDEAREMFTDGFFKPGVPQHSYDKPSKEFVKSVLDYAESIGILASSKSLTMIPPHRQNSSSNGEINYIPDSVEYLAYTIDDIGYREKIDSAFLSAIARSRGKAS